MNTTRSQDRNEATGEEAQNYLYMWKHACAFTKWVPSNQFMYSNLDYNPETMTLERFGFIGMDKKCFWGSIGVLWKRPLPVEQILPNNTKVEPVPAKPDFVVTEGMLVNRKSKDGICLIGDGKIIKLGDCTKDADGWQFMKRGHVIHKKSGLCMTTTNTDYKTPITLEECTPKGKDQKWKITNEGNDGSFGIESYLKDNAKDNCLDIPGFSGKSGLKAQMCGCQLHTKDNMLYRLIVKP